jgi:hypothetical protein
MKTYIVLTALLVCVGGDALAKHHVISQNYYLDSLINAEFGSGRPDPVTWDLNKRLGMANFVLQDEWAWAKLLSSGKIDTDRNFTVTLVGQNDRQVGIAEFRAVFAADMARADTLLYRLRLLCVAKDRNAQAHNVLFERAYETAYARDENVAAIVAR